MFQRLRKYWERQKVFREIGSFDEPGLVYAAEEGNLECLEILLQTGVSPNAVSERGYPALCRAVTKDHLPTIRLLMEAGADPDLSDQQGITPLMYSIRSGNRHIFTYLLTQEPDLEQADKQGETAIFKAVREGNTTITRKLIEAGAEVDVINQNGHTPLMLAVKNERIGVVKALLNVGADPNIRNQQGKNVLEFDVQSPRLMHMLRKASLQFKQEEQAAIQSEKRSPILPLDDLSGGLLGSMPSLGSTMLRMLNLSLQALNSPYRADDVEQHGRDLVKRMLRQEPLNGNGHSNGHSADQELKLQLTQLIKWLQHQEGQGSGRSHFDQVELDRSLLEAAALGAHRIVPILLDLGASPEARDGEGNTPLHLAIRHPSVIKQLLNAGAQTKAHNQQGYTPQELAERHRLAATLDLLSTASSSNNSAT